MRARTVLWFIRVKAFRLIDFMTLPESLLAYCQLDVNQQIPGIFCKHKNHIWRIYSCENGAVIHSGNGSSPVQLPSHCRNQCWLIANCTLFNKFQTDSFRNAKLAWKRMHLKIPFAECRPLCWLNTRVKYYPDSVTSISIFVQGKVLPWTE